MEDQVVAALEIATRYGTIDGAHHKAWVIDQMVRALTDCPLIECLTHDAFGKAYTYTTYGESDHYCDFVANCGEWDEGIAP